MANQDDLQQKLRMGMDAARRGDKAAAQVMLREVVAADPDNELAWLWLASTVDNLEERRAHLERVLQINPNNSRAEEALRRLRGGQATSASTSTSPARRSFRPPSLSGEGEAPSPVTIIVAAVVGVAVLMALIFALVASQQPADPTRQEIVARLSPTLTPTINPTLFTPTRTPNSILVTPNVELPPSYTPSASPSPAPTLTPSPTAIPPSAFAMIYTSVEAGAADAGLYLLAGDGSPAQLLGPDVRDIAFDPSGEKVAFVRAVTVAADAPPPADGEDSGEDSPTTEDAVYYELFIAPVDDLGAAEQITRFNGVISSPAWAPNGFQLVFVSDFSGTEDIWTITDDGLNFDNLTDSEGVDRDPAWSPDGSRIVYVSDSNSPGLTKLYSMDSFGEDKTLLLDMAGNTYQPTWSPDGSMLAFVNDGNGDGDIFIAEANGQGSLLLTTDDGGAEDRSPSFTPDGRWLGFASNRDGGTFNLYAVDLQGSSLIQLTDSAEDQQELDFRPDLALRLLNQN